MPHGKLSNLGNEVRKHRGNNTLRETARVIGISPATLMRVESGRVPDVATFGKLCGWLGVDPGSYLGTKPTAGAEPAPSPHLVMSAHFKAEKTPHPDTVMALAKLIMFAATSRRQRTSLTDGDT